jgi:O-acetyl-ADP-ribose deacetylase (regulator of RNase III)
MPLFLCPKCGRQYLVPLAICESFLDDMPMTKPEESTEAVFGLPCPDCSPKNIRVIEGDLLDQDVDVIVNSWNRNIIPWWLLLPQGVSGAIKKHGGIRPFKELRRHGPIPLGGAVLTSACKLPFKGIIHVAGINMLWRASERSIRDSVRNAMAVAEKNEFQSIAFPLIGAGSGAFDQERAKEIMLDELQNLDLPLKVTVVVFKKWNEPFQPHRF